MTILPYPRGVRNKGLITPKNVISTCIRFLDTKLKFHRYVNDFFGQVVDGFTILP